MIVQIHRNYEFPDLLRQTPGNSGQWGDFKFTYEHTDKADFILVLNRPLKDINTKCLKGGKIVMMQEPPYEKNRYFKLHFRFYDHIISGFKSDNQFKIINAQAALPWHVNKTYDELVAMPVNHQKQDKVSWITSNNLLFPQHKVRLDFVDYLKKNNYPFDLFGRGFQPIADKFDGIAPYKYSIAAENYIDQDYFTEKIIDVYLSWSMPIYAGCTNITHYFPAESLIQIDLNDHQASMEKIEYAVKNRLWDKNIEAIRHARELILNKYQLFPMMTEFMTGQLKNMQTNKYQSTFIPASGLTRTEELKKKVRNMLGLGK